MAKIKYRDNQQYAIYDLYDNYIFGGNKLDLSRFLNRKIAYINKMISTYFGGKTDYIIVDGIMCKLYKIDD